MSNVVLVIRIIFHVHFFGIPVALAGHGLRFGSSLESDEGGTLWWVVRDEDNNEQNGGADAPAGEL